MSSYTISLKGHREMWLCFEKNIYNTVKTGSVPIQEITCSNKCSHTYLSYSTMTFCDGSSKNQKSLSKIQHRMLNMSKINN